MNPWPTNPLSWGRLVIAGLLFVLAGTVLLMTRLIERDASLVEIDSVPGLVDANTIRSACSEEFACIVQAVDRPAGTGGAGLAARLAEFDQRLSTAVAHYRDTIHIDPAKDKRLLGMVLAAHRKYLDVRGETLALLAANRMDEAQSRVASALAPAYASLVRECDVLVEYNSATGTAYTGRMARTAATLRWAALAILLIVMAALLVVRKEIARERAMERELLESGEKLALAFRVSPHSMAITRRSDGRIIAVNDAFRRHYGVTAEDVTRYTAVDVGVWKSDVERERVLRELEKTGRLTNYVKKRPLPDGSERTLLVSAEPVVLAGEPCLLAVGQDITDRVKAEEALARSEAELRTIFDRAAIGIALVESHGRPIRVNPALERFLGYTGAELCQLSFAEFTHPEEASRDLQLFGQLLAGEVQSYHLEKRYVRKDGAVVWGHLTTSAVRDRAPRDSYVIAMVEDITERKRAELALRESETARHQLQQQLIVAQKLEALGQLAGGVAHDFNNIIAAMTLHLDALKVVAGPDHQSADAIDELIRTAKRASRLTRQLLLFSRREPARRAIVDLDAIIANLLVMLERLVGDQHTLVHLRGAEARWVSADASMLEQVVMNLVVNARDAMPQGGRIQLITDEFTVASDTAAAHRDAKPGRYVRLVVTDTGMGMSAAVMQRLFEPFFTTKPPGRGTGLGLSTVFGIVKQHEGWIDVASVEGQGSTFTVCLPQADGTPETPGGSPRATGAGRATILLADKNAPVRGLSARILEAAGYAVVQAASLAEARAAMEAQPAVDLVVADPGISSDNALVEVESLLRPGRTKLLLLATDQISRVAQKVDGTTPCLSKPFTTEQLLNAVRTQLDRATEASARPGAT